MPTTSRGLRFPAAGESPNGPLQVGNLASDVNAQLVDIYAKLAGRQRVWTFGRAGNSSDTFAAGDFVVVQSNTITGAPAGDYTITARLVITNTIAIAGFQRTLAGGVSISPSDPRADTIVAGMRHVFVQSGGITHAGGNLTVAQYYNASNGSPTVWSQGTELTIVYLGPR